MRYGLLTFEEPQIDSSRKILHVDMDAFYASIEIRDKPGLANQPVVIARHPEVTGGKGIVATCNYKARQYGIHSAMPAVEAYRLCPKAVFVPGRHAYYQEVSQQIRDIFYQYTDLVEPLSLDEAYLDVTHNKKGDPSALRIAQTIQREIYETLHLTSSVGVSYNKFIAKIASDYHKPHGITLVTPADAIDFLKDLPIDKFYGVGQRSIDRFHELGIYKGADLYQMELDDLIQSFGKMGYSLYFKVRGIHPSPVSSHRDRKSIGKESTFSHFTQDEGEVITYLDRLALQVYTNYQQKGVRPHTVTLKIRYQDFTTVTRQAKHEMAIMTLNDLQAAVLDLWHTYGDLSQSVRLLGVTVSQFEVEGIESFPLNIE